MNVIEFDVVLTFTSLRISSIFVAPLGPSVVPEVVVAKALLIVTLPKFGIAASEPVVAGYTCRTHSASAPQSLREEDSVRVLVTEIPVVRFCIRMVEAVVDVAVSVSLTESPALKVIPEKS